MAQGYFALLYVFAAVGWCVSVVAHSRSIARMRESQRVFAVLILDLLTVQGRIRLSPEQFRTLMDVMEGGQAVREYPPEQ